MLQFVMIHEYYPGVARRLTTFSQTFFQPRNRLASGNFAAFELSYPLYNDYCLHELHGATRPCITALLPRRSPPGNLRCCCLDHQPSEMAGQPHVPYKIEAALLDQPGHIKDARGKVLRDSDIIGKLLAGYEDSHSEDDDDDQARRQQEEEEDEQQGNGQEEVQRQQENAGGERPREAHGV